MASQDSVPPIGAYLKKSAAAHVLILAGMVLTSRGGSAPPQQVYRIDFIGASSAILNRKGGEATAPEKPLPAPSFAKPDRQKDPDTFNLKPSFTPLPRPSFLDAARPEKKPTPPSIAKLAPAQAPAPRVPPGSGATAPAAGAGIGSVSADMPDFPYPWYLTSLRQKLWSRWSGRMPAEEAECLVMFSIMRDGSIVDVRVESTSGERAVDTAALSAVRESAPLPPLPPAFRERFLKVHVQFKSN